MRLQQPFGVVTPSLDGDVLNVLAAADGWFTAPRITSLIHDRSIEGVRRVLTRLTAEGIVELQPAGQAYLYRLNRGHLAAEAIMALAGQRDELFRRISAAINGWTHPARYAAVFGSAATRQMRVDSDIDLFLVRPGDADVTWGDDVATLCALASRWTGNDVRPLEYGERELKAAGREPVLQDIAEEGITMVGDRVWFRRELGLR